LSAPSGPVQSELAWRGEARGGTTAITPVTRPFESLQRYDPDSNVLETLFQLASNSREHGLADRSTAWSDRSAHAPGARWQGG
jgi:hypothetical protein